MFCIRIKHKLCLDLICVIKMLNLIISRRKRTAQALPQVCAQIMRLGICDITYCV